MAKTSVMTGWTSASSLVCAAMSQQNQYSADVIPPSADMPMTLRAGWPRRVTVLNMLLVASLA
jgi:hypothetical protein